MLSRCERAERKIQTLNCHELVAAEADANPALGEQKDKVGRTDVQNLGVRDPMEPELRSSDKGTRFGYNWSLRMSEERR